MAQFSVHDAKTNLSRLIARVICHSDAQLGRKCFMTLGSSCGNG